MRVQGLDFVSEQLCRVFSLATRTIRIREEKNFVHADVKDVVLAHLGLLFLRRFSAGELHGADKQWNTDT